MKRCVCAYARVSTLSEEQQLSFTSQKKYFEQYCRDKGYELYKVYSDEGISGTSTRHREGLLELLSECGVTIDSNGLFKVTKCNPPFSLILISNTSRLGRNLEDVRAIVRCLRENKVYIHFIDSNINTEDSSSDFMLNLLQLFDEQFSSDLSSKVKNGFLKSVITTNKVHTNSKLYGYELKDNKLIAIPSEVEVIRLIFDLYEQGKGFRVIGNELEARGITTREGKRFNKTTLVNIVTQEKYCGINNRLKYKKRSISSTTAQIREDSKQYYKDTEDIEPIITKEQFNKCQQILQSKQGDRKGVNRGNSPYATKIRCGKCNSSYTSNKDKGRAFYNCSNKAKYGLSKCNNRNISLNKLNELLNSEWLVTSLEAIKLQQKTYIKRSINKLEASKDIDNIKQVEALKIELTELEDKKSKLLDLYLDGIVDKLHYTEKLHSLEASITRISAMIEEYSRDNNSIDEIIESKYKLIEEVNKLKIEPYYSREEIISYIHTIIVEGNCLTISLNIGGEPLELPEQIRF